MKPKNPEQLKTSEKGDINIDEAIEELIESGEIPFNKEFTEINGEKIEDSKFIHPAKYIKELQEDFKSWNLRDQFIHVADQMSYNVYRKKFESTRTLRNVRYPNGEERSDLLVPIVFTSIGGYDLERLKQISKDEYNQHLEMAFSNNVLILKTDQNAYYIWNFSGNNNDYLYPDNLRNHDNHFCVDRTGHLILYKFKREYFDEIENFKGLVSLVFPKRSDFEDKNREQLFVKHGKYSQDTSISYEDYQRLLPHIGDELVDDDPDFYRKLKKIEK